MSKKVNLSAPQLTSQNLALMSNASTIKLISKEKAFSLWNPLAVMRNNTNIVRNNPNIPVLEHGQKEKNKTKTKKMFLTTM